MPIYIFLRIPHPGNCIGPKPESAVSINVSVDNEYYGYKSRRKRLFIGAFYNGD